MRRAHCAAPLPPPPRHGRPTPQFAAAALGFFCYKAPLLTRQIVTAVRELNSAEAEVPVTASAMPVGSLGMALKVLRPRGGGADDEAPAASAATPAERAAATAAKRLVVICGPSGVGKSSLIAKLLEDYPGRCAFVVSDTTRPPRPGETDGVDYFFRSEAEFDGMVDRNEFVEWASVGSHRYGTSSAGVLRVAESGKLCLLDLDVQGVQSLLAMGSTFDPLCIWIAPPSLDVLRARLRARGEENAEIEARLARATSEIEFCLSSRVFDKVGARPARTLP